MAEHGERGGGVEGFGLQAWAWEEAAMDTKQLRDHNNRK
jgi:hypothetical protein